jgi:hypothetical protein
MPEQVVGYPLTVCPQGVEGGLEIPRIPQNYGCDQEVEPRGALDLAFEGAVPQLSEAVEEDRASERIARLAFVQPGVGPSSQIDVPTDLRRSGWSKAAGPPMDKF